MNEPEQFIVDLIESNKGTIVSQSPLEFRGNAILVGMVNYFGYETTQLYDSVYQVDTTIPGLRIITSPVNVVLPVISGTLIEGQTLSVTTGIWA